MTINLPFDIGNIVYTIDFKDEIEFVAERKVYSVEVDEFGTVIRVEDLEGNVDSFVFDQDWNDTYFLSRIEASLHLNNRD